MGKKLLYGCGGLMGLVVIVVIIGVATSGPNATSKSSGATTASSSPSQPASTLGVASPTPKATPSGPLTTFGDGTWAVGVQIAAGTYQTAGGSSCYWERDSDLTGSASSILANGNTIGHVVVTILSTDKGFQTQGCGTWAPLPAAGAHATTFGDGIWAVGINIAPGSYSAPGGSSCYWETDSDLTGNASSIVANGNPRGPVTLTIPGTDKGFQTQGCGTWTPVTP